MTQDSDIIIVGGNLAGNYLAFLLARQGMHPLVIEEHLTTQIGRPVHCTGIVSQKILRLMDVPAEIILNRVEKAAIYAPSGQHATIGSKSEVPVVIDRAALDRHFYELAIAEGARYITGQRVHEIAKTPSGVKIYTHTNTYTGNIVVGADGPMSVVAQYHGIIHDYIYGVQARVQLDNYPNDTTDLHFHPYWRDFFGWIVPEGNGLCRVGLGDWGHPNMCFKYFLHSLGVERSQLVETNGGIIPMGYLGAQAFNRAILLGDAACQVKASSAGGLSCLRWRRNLHARRSSKQLKPPNIRKLSSMKSTSAV